MLSFEKTIKTNLIGYHFAKRSQVYVGFKCNQKCAFCYHIDRITEDMFPKEYVFRQIDLLLDYGIVDFEITGGEPSECKYLRDYCLYIKTKSPKSKIAVITNGGLFASDVWDVIDEVLISYHISKNDNNINREIFPMGDTYSKVYKTLEKAKKTNKIIRINTIIATFNIDGIRYILDDILSFEPHIVNFLPLNLFDNAFKTMKEFIDYENIRVCVKKSIDYIKQHNSNIYINVRYMPLCKMEGYEKFIIGTYQHAFDFFDWNVELGGLRLLKYLDFYKTNDEILKILGSINSTTLNACSITRNLHYEKSKECMFCKYFLICDGVEKTNTQKYIKFIHPSYGKIITDINFFTKNNSEKLYNKLYENK